jgi:hypothetical protein
MCVPSNLSLNCIWDTKLFWQLSDDSDFDMQRQAEIEAERAYEEALRKHEEMEFREARESLSHATNDVAPSRGYGRRTGMQMMSSTGSRIRV